MGAVRLRERAVVGVLLALLAGVGCGSARERPAHLPPPVYERPELPPWEPEPAPDPLDGDLEGEWVEDPGEPAPRQSPPPEDSPPRQEPSTPEAPSDSKEPPAKEPPAEGPRPEGRALQVDPRAFACQSPPPSRLS